MGLKHGTVVAEFYIVPSCSTFFGLSRPVVSFSWGRVLVSQKGAATPRSFYFDMVVKKRSALCLRELDSLVYCTAFAHPELCDFTHHCGVSPCTLLAVWGGR